MKGKTIKCSYWSEGLVAVKGKKGKDLYTTEGKLLEKGFESLTVKAPLAIIQTRTGSAVYHKRQKLFELNDGTIDLDKSTKDHLFVECEKGHYVLDGQGNRINDTYYDEIFPFDRKERAFARKGTRWMVLDADLNVLKKLESKFDKVEQLSKWSYEYVIYSSSAKKERYLITSTCLEIVNKDLPFEKIGHQKSYFTTGMLNGKLSPLIYNNECGKSYFMPPELTKVKEINYLYATAERDGHPVVLSYDLEEVLFWDLQLDEIIPTLSKKDEYANDEADNFIVRKGEKCGIATAYNLYNDSSLSKLLIYDDLKYIPGSLYFSDGMNALFELFSEEKMGILSAGAADTLVPPIFDKVELIFPMTDYGGLRTFIVEENNKKGIYHYPDGIVMPIEYDKLSIVPDYDAEEGQYLILEKDGEYTLLWDNMYDQPREVLTTHLDKKPSKKSLQGRAYLPLTIGGTTKYAVLEYGQAKYYNTALEASEHLNW